ncbi:MAG TPA: branched-chain amino acid ABC transporter ATP-binding protein/permease [Trebonia sp.]|jgi:branched-chain amino acid transport system permease protein|nr:branched-chain amino acid ABC transporter ATP-binding protein/permease [Trebonia sp.]
MTQARIRRPLIALALVALAVFPLVSDDLYYQAMLILTFLLAIGATGWNIMGGYAGYISLGNSAFIGLGAYTTGILAAKDNLSPFLGCLAGGLVAAVAAAVLSLVTRRTRGMYFIIVTFAALQLLGIVATIWSGLTGGSQGLALPIPSWPLTYQNWPFYYPLLALLVLSVAVSAWVRRSKLGAGLFAIADDEDKAAGLGLATNADKLIAFVLGGTFLGVAGGIYAYYVTFLNVSAVFDIVTSMLIVLSALLGGRGTLWGPVLGAFIIEPLANLTSTSLGGANAGAIRLLLFGGLLGLVVLFLPRGLIPTVSAWKTQRQGQDQKQDDPERLRLTLVGPVTKEGDRTAAGATTTAGTGTVLAVRGLARSFGGLRAVDDVDLDLPTASVTGLIGPNGSGKTTLFNLVDGTVRPSSGRLTLGGRRVDHKSRQARAHAGLARTYQLPRLFPSLTVLENVVLAERQFSVARLFLPRVTAAERGRAMAVLADLGLAQYASTSPAALSYGQRKLIELAQVLWLAPALILLDEPAAGISPALSQRLAGMIRDLRAEGVGVLLVEHDVAFVASLSDRVYVMANGKIIASGTVAEVSADQAVVDAYLGDQVALAAGHPLPVGNTFAVGTTGESAS